LVSAMAVSWRHPVSLAFSHALAARPSRDTQRVKPFGNFGR
jgi:hypothetical protein